MGQAPPETPKGPAPETETGPLPKQLANYR